MKIGAKELFKKPLVLILAAAGVVLLLLGSGTTPSSSTEKTTLTAETENYRRALESELITLCEKVTGAGKVSLLLTLDGSEEAVYAKDERQNGGSDYVVSSGEGLLLYHKHPTVLGVAVVCTGGGDPSVRAELTALLSAALGVGSNRIYITSGQS
ncbi:MAG: hypothetical protein IJ009_00335 [Clostridia bacterium]|nr:hypothetical protein [Clostridia bacterium]